jgi:hypothetical protein
MANTENVFSVESIENSITVGGRKTTMSGAVKKVDLNKAAKDAGIRNFVVKNEDGEDLSEEDFPYEGAVKIVEYNAAKVFSVTSTENKILVCGRSVPLSGAVKKVDLNKAAKDAGIRNFVVKNEDGEDLSEEDFPYEGTVKIVEYNAAKINGKVFTVE